jgi:trimeric autotransporter adhesin
MLDFPYGLALDAAGNVLVADTNNSRIRVVAAVTGTFYGIAMTAGDIYTIAGSSTEGYGGDGGPATSAKLAFPAGVSVDAAGNVVIADTASSRIRVVAAATGTFYGIAMTTADIYTVAGDGTRGYSGDGGPAAAAKVREPQDVAVDRSGNLVIADTANKRIRVVAESAGTFYGHPMAAGDIYTDAGTGLLLSGNRGKAVNAETALPENVEDSLPGLESAATGIAADAAGDVAFYDNGEVRVVPAASGTLFGQPVTGGDIYAVAGDGHLGYSGDGGPGTAATVQAAGGLAFDHDGNLVIADTGNHVVRVVAADTGTFYGRAMTAGDIYTVAGDGGNGYSGNTGPATLAELSDPAAVAVDAAGNLLIADTNINLRSVPGRIRVVAASSGTFYGQAMTAGHIYSVAGSDARHTTGSGGPAMTAHIDYPRGLAVDPSGNLIIAETDVNSIWVVAARTGTFFGQAMTAGDIYQVAAVGFPLGLAADRHGNVLIVQGLGGGPVRALAAQSGTFYGVHMTTGGLFTVAGSLNFGYSGDGGPAVDALMFNPEAVAVAPDGDLLITDDGNRRVREVTP